MNFWDKSTKQKHFNIISRILGQRSETLFCDPEVSFFGKHRKELCPFYSLYTTVNPIRTGVWIPPPPLRFFALYSKNFFTTQTRNFLTFPNFWLLIPLWNFFFEKFCFHPLTALLRHAVQKYFFVFCFNQKNLFTKPSWNNF